jgi:drug/metabolite transporter (DMT)-like permease
MTSMTGALFCLASAACFGAMGIFGKLAYEEGSTVGTLLATRFALAAAVLWLVVAITRTSLRGIARRDVLMGLALGAIGYAAQAGGFFAALDRMDASLLALVLYTFPVMVTVAAIALGRERASRRTAAALLLASTGLVLVLAGAAAGALDAVGTALGLLAAGVYTVYILVSDGVTRRVAALPLTALVCTGAAAMLILAGIVTGDLRLGAVSAAGFGWLGAIALVSTVAAVLLFFAGLRRAGPSAASILSTIEPVVTVALAAVIFGEHLGPAQLVGAALVLSAALMVRLRDRDVLVEVDVLDGVQEGDALVHRPLEGLAARDEAGATRALVDDRGLDGLGEVGLAAGRAT